MKNDKIYDFFKFFEIVQFKNHRYLVFSYDLRSLFFCHQKNIELQWFIDDDFG